MCQSITLMKSSSLNPLKYWIDGISALLRTFLLQEKELDTQLKQALQVFIVKCLGLKTTSEKLRKNKFVYKNIISKFVAQ